MNLSRTSLLALAVAIIFTTWLTGLHFKNKQAGKRKSLYASPDDLDGAAAYDYYRLRNPATGQIPDNVRKRELAFAANLPQNVSRSTNWQNRGPYNQGGRTRAVALDVTDTNTILVGQVTGGMWRSTNGGQSFTQSITPQQLHSCTCVAQDTRPGNTNVWYYGTGEEYAIVNADGFSSQFSGDGIFKSTDGGVTWAQLPSTVQDTIPPADLYGKRNFDFVWNVITNPTNLTQDEVYAAVVNGIWRSVDGGNSWTSVLGLNPDSANTSLYTAIAITSTGVLYATISSETYARGIWRSTDGINWTNITPGNFPTDYERIELGIAPLDENLVYFIADAPGYGPNGNALFRYYYLSGNGAGTGGQWTDLSANIPHDHCINYENYDFEDYNTQGSYDMYITVSAPDTGTVFLGGTDLYRNSLGFNYYDYSWIGGYRCDTALFASYLYPGHHPDQHKLIFFPSNGYKAISANDGGIMETQNIFADTVVWQSLDNGYVTGQFYTCAIEPGNTSSNFIIGGLQDNGTYLGSSLNNSQIWSQVLGGDGGYCAITHNRTNYYASFEYGKLFKMTINDNDTVTGLTRIDPSGGGSEFAFVSPFILDPLNDTIMYLPGGNFIWRNDSLTYLPVDSDEKYPIKQGWVKLNGTIFSGEFPVPNITALNMSEANTDRLYFGTDLGTVYRLDSCRTSTTHPRVNITDTAFPVGAYVSCVEPDRLNANNVMVTFSNYGVISIFYSSDSGAHWQNVSGNLEENPDGSGDGPSVTWAHIYNDGTIKTYYVGTSTGLYSTDTLQGLNTVWAQEGTSTIGNEIVDMITSRVYDGNIVVATHGNGVYSNKTFTSVSNVSRNALEMNCYPNPFTSSTVIELGGALTGQTEVEFYDVNGKMLKQLNANNTKQIIWDGNDVNGNNCPAGIYLVRVTNGNSVLSAKVVKL